MDPFGYIKSSTCYEDDEKEVPISEADDQT
jgi:hypothetical protein